MLKQIAFLFLLLLNMFFVFGQDDLERSMTLGNKHFLNRNFQSAATYYERALKAKGADMFIHYRLAECYTRLYDARAATHHADRAYRLKRKKNPQLSFVVAEAKHIARHFEEAIIYYQEAIAFAGEKLINKRITECNYGMLLVKKSVDAVISNMGPHINSHEHDITPLITADESELYFSSYRTEHYGKQKGSLEEIYSSTKTLDKWEMAKNIGEPLNTPNNDACVGLSHDGQTMFLFKGNKINRDIYITYKDGEGWKEPVPIFNSLEMEFSACLSPDGHTIYLVKNNENQKDLYTSQRINDSTWSVPTLMDSIINTPYDERTPYIHPDGKTLFFSSNGKNTMGGFDIFKTVKGEDGWSVPVNLGYPINSVADELGFVLAAGGTSGFFASTRFGGRGKFDIYHATLPKNNDYELVLVKGKVKDILVDKAIETTITITDEDQNEVYSKVQSNEVTGSYLISLETGKEYTFRVEGDGILHKEEKIFVEKGKGFVEINQEMEVVDAKPGVKFTFEHILFDFGLYDLNPLAKEELEHLISVLKRFPELKVEIAGHTDNIGSEEDNMLLSENRAKAVVDYIIGQGIASDNISFKGYGSSRAIDTNETEEGRSKNRRTELEVK